jgi:hypothetical protein
MRYVGPQLDIAEETQRPLAVEALEELAGLADARPARASNFSQQQACSFGSTPR